MTNTEQIAAMAERIEKLEGVLQRAVPILDEYGRYLRDIQASPQQTIRPFKVVDEARALLSSGDQG